MVVIQVSDNTNGRGLEARPGLMFLKRLQNNQHPVQVNAHGCRLHI